jgi:hypothetical protein
MSNPTSNFGWVMPTSTDLVTDLPADFEVFGQAVDTSLADLKGGTTGQILAKATNANMDFTWVTNDVGDITAVTAGTGITGGGTSGDVTVSFDQANFGGGQNSAGKNEVLNSNFSVWQRGTSIAGSGSAPYTADRWSCYRATTGSTVSRQVTNDATNLPFIQYCARVQRDSGNTGTGAIVFYQSMETVNSIPFAGKTVTLSFYARAGANFSAASSALNVNLNAGTGTDQNALSYTGPTNPISTTTTLTTTWQRFTFSATIATSVTELAPYIFYTPVGTAGAADYYEITGVQLEAASTASPYAPNTSTYQAELAACQRYYYRITASATYSRFPTLGTGISTTSVHMPLTLPVTMRTSPSVIDTGGAFRIYDGVGVVSVASIGLISSTDIGASNTSYIAANVAAGATVYRPYMLTADNSASAYIGFGAEL